MAGQSVAIIGAGIAGLTAALAFAARGAAATVFERAPRIEELGAGLQLSPNATRLLARLGVLDEVKRKAVEPKSVVIRCARDLRPLAEVPLHMAERRWGAPYLVMRRSDLQGVLLEAARGNDGIAIRTGTEVSNLCLDRTGGSVRPNIANSSELAPAFDLAVAADGVWSATRQRMGGPKSRFTGDIAYRAILDAGKAGPFRDRLLPSDQVVTFASPGFHLVAYPLPDGAFNLVIIVRGQDMPRHWTNVAEAAQISGTARNIATELKRLITVTGIWHAWPIHEVKSAAPWCQAGRIVLIGDAAHAIAPHAAQGAAMAIEDAVLLANLTTRSGAPGRTLDLFEKLRRPRLIRVAMRGQFNHFAWQVGGPIALVRNLILKARSGEKLAADFDWLYGYDVEKAAA